MTGIPGYHATWELDSYWKKIQFAEVWMSWTYDEICDFLGLPLVTSGNTGTPATRQDRAAAWQADASQSPNGL